MLPIELTTELASLWTYEVPVMAGTEVGLDGPCAYCSWVGNQHLDRWKADHLFPFGPWRREYRRKRIEDHEPVADVNRKIDPNTTFIRLCTLLPIEFRKRKC
jgi:hypothetical protein